MKQDAPVANEASPMVMPQGNTMEAAAMTNEVVPMAQPAASNEVWQECVNCDVTHEVVSDGVYKDL